MTGDHPNRKRLPDTRDSITHKVVIDHTNDLFIIVGLYPDTGAPAELFIELGKPGSTMRGMCDWVAVSTSLLLQHGVDLENLCNKFENTKFEPHGVTTNKDIPACSSIPDYVFKWLRLRFIERYQNARATSISDDAPDKEVGGETSMDAK